MTAAAERTEAPDIAGDVQSRFGDAVIGVQRTADGTPTLWIAKDRVASVLAHLKRDVPQPYRMLYDLTAIDERNRTHRTGQPPADFTVVYHLLSFERNADIRLKVPLAGELRVRSITDIWPAANWYECEAWDLFGIVFEGHPHLRRILLPPTWKGHPLRKDHPARATEMEPYRLPDEKEEREQEALRFDPEAWGMRRRHGSTDFMFLNLGPNHPSAHGVFRVVLQLDGEEIVDAVPDIGYHHRAAEKMGERQSWHTYIPYTDRVDYLGGVMNELPYLHAVERLAGIELPDRAKVIRIMMAEFFRIANHLLYVGTLAQDLGQMSPVFYTFNDRERIHHIVEAVCGGRMHPEWFRIGGVHADLPEGWDRLVGEFLDVFVPRIAEFEKLTLGDRIFRDRTRDIGTFTVDDGIEWGATGPMLRATGFSWDFRKARPYGGYDQFEFEVPVGSRGDCYDRCLVHMHEMRQSARIIRQCLEHMPPGPYKSAHPLTTPPVKERTMHDIETLITHFLSVSWGPVIPAGEACMSIEATKGNNGYYLVSDGGTMPYRVRIRTPSFAHLQMIPLMCRGLGIADLVAILGSIDYVMADVDR
jgi:NADH-quinone oxidoreductase subunit C/D